MSKLRVYIFVCLCVSGLFVEVYVLLSFKAFSSLLVKKFLFGLAFQNTNFLATHVETLAQIIFCSVLSEGTWIICDMLCRCKKVCPVLSNIEPLVYRFLSLEVKTERGSETWPSCQLCVWVFSSCCVSESLSTPVFMARI